jgi:hypothetical protein
MLINGKEIKMEDIHSSSGYKLKLGLAVAACLIIVLILRKGGGGWKQYDMCSFWSVSTGRGSNLCDG